MSRLENGRAYTPGGSTEKKRLLDARHVRGRTRRERCAIVWHFQAFDEARTFRSATGSRARRRLRRRRRRQPQGLGRPVGCRPRRASSRHSRRRAGSSAPGATRSMSAATSRCTGHACRCARSTSRRTSSSSFERRPARRVHLDRRHAGRRRATGSPRSSPRRQRTRGVPARPRPHREREAPPVVAAARAARDRHAPRCGVLLAVWWFYGRERPTGYDREYEQEPPTDTRSGPGPAPARARREAGSFEFTATLFDLIRRKVYKATPTTTERSTWGGLHKEQLADLESRVR